MKMMNKQNIMLQRAIILIGLLTMVILPTTALSAGPDYESKIRVLGIDDAVANGRIGVMDAHINMRMADAVVDLVRINSTWIVAGVMIDYGTYIPNGPWTSSTEIDAFLGAEVLVFRNDTNCTNPVFEILENAGILCWRIAVLDFLVSSRSAIK